MVFVHFSKPQAHMFTYTAHYHKDLPFEKRKQPSVDIEIKDPVLQESSEEIICWGGWCCGAYWLMYVHSVTVFLCDLKCEDIVLLSDLNYKDWWKMACWCLFPFLWHPIFTRCVDCLFIFWKTIVSESLVDCSVPAWYGEINWAEIGLCMGRPAWWPESPASGLGLGVGLAFLPKAWPESPNGIK